MFIKPALLHAVCILKHKHRVLHYGLEWTRQYKACSATTHLPDFVDISSILFKADVIKPGIIVQCIPVDFCLILEPPFTDYHILQCM